MIGKFPKVYEHHEFDWENSNRKIIGTMSDWITLSKWLPLLVYPFNVVQLLLFLGLLFRLFRRPRTAWSIVILSIFVLGIFSSPISVMLYRQHERTYLPLPIDKIPVAGAIVLLAGDVGIPLWPRIESQLTGNRALHAFRLYHSGKAPIVIISGGNVFPQEGVLAEAEYTRGILQSWGIPKSAILLETTSRNTQQNAIYTSELLDQLEIDKILLVTTAIHMPRAVATFLQKGVDVIPAPSGYSVVGTKRPVILEWWPKLGNMNKAQAYIHEVLGMQIYRLRGWIH